MATRKPQKRGVRGNPLPPRTADTMSDAIALSSPSGRMSKRARAAAEKRLAKALFGDESLKGEDVPTPKSVILRRTAANLRGLAERGMKPRAYKKKVEELEREATKLEAVGNPLKEAEATFTGIDTGNKHEWLADDATEYKTKAQVNSLALKLAKEWGDSAVEWYGRRLGYGKVENTKLIYAREGEEDVSLFVTKAHSPTTGDSVVIGRYMTKRQAEGGAYKHNQRYPNTYYTYDVETVKRKDLKKALKNPVEFAVPLVQGIATGTGFGIAAGITAPFAVKAGKRILGRRKNVGETWADPISYQHLWAIYKGKLYFSKKTGHDFNHTEWFGLIGLPPSGEAFDRVERGHIRVNDFGHGTSKTVLAISYGGRWTPKIVFSTIYKKYPKLKKYKLKEDRMFNPKRIGVRGNPPNSAQSLSEEFHGRPSTETEEFDQTEEYHDELAGLGDLTELEVVTKNGKFKTPLDFSGDEVSLASTPNGKQLHFIGGEQGLDDNFLKAMGLSKSEIDRDMVKLGVVHTISYFADKHHLTGSKSQKDGTEYIHEFGEAGGSKPMLVYDKLNERLGLVGGSYVVKGEGVVN